MPSKSLFKTVTFVTVFFASAAYFLLIAFNLSAAPEKMSLEQRVQHLEELNKTKSKVQAELTFQLNELQREVRLLTGQLEENSFKLKQIQDRQRDLYREIEARFSAMSKQTLMQKSNASTTSKSIKKPTTRIPINTSPTDNIEARKNFEAAFAMVRNKNYDKALEAFSDFLTQYPQSSYSANARYWMGQVYLVKNNLDEAEKQFSQLIAEFPQSSKISGAKLKLGDISFKQQKWQQAKSYYTDVNEHDNGAQQQLARKGLDKIKQAGH